MAFSGKYTLVKNEGQYEHLIAGGLSEDRAKRAIDEANTLEICINTNKVTISRIANDKGHTQTLTFNEETEEKGPADKVFKVTAFHKDESLIVESKSDDITWTRIYTINGDELTVISRISKPGVPDGKRIYQKGEN